MTRHSSVLQHWNSRAIVFLILAIAGLVGTWTYNIIAIIEQRDFFGDWFGSGPAVGSLTMDLLIMAVAACAFIVIEGRRLGMRHLWAYIVFAGITAIAFTFPLFLANRERHLQRSAATAAEAPATA
jgi:low affinity Fe/Cu permease